MYFQLIRNKTNYLFLLVVLAVAFQGHGQNANRGIWEIPFSDSITKTGEKITLPGSDDGVPYSEFQYLVIDVEHSNPASSIVLLGFGRKGDLRNKFGFLPNRLKCRIGVLPGLRTQIIFPLEYLNAQEIFLPRYPRQLKGTLEGERIEARDIDEVYVFLQKHDGFLFNEELKIHRVFLSQEMPAPLPVPDGGWVDSLGQWSLKDWPGKLQTLSELEPAFNQSLEEYGGGDEADQRSMFYGYLDLKFDSTGYFHTHHDGKRWWFVDPLGYAYLSIAPTGINPGSAGPIANNPELFSYLPDENEYRPAYSQTRGLKSLSFVTVNLMRLFGQDWESEWIQTTRKLLTGMGFTGSGNWSDRKFQVVGQMPYVYAMSGFPSTSINLFRDFPDVFDPAFEESAAQYAAQLSSKRNDPWMIGYFLGNEPHWAFGDYNLAREMLYKNRGSESRAAMISWLKKKYHDSPYELSAAWEFEFTSFEELKAFVLPHEKYISESAEADLREFTRILIDRYAQVICDAVKKVDPYHLNLGLRFAWISSPACLQTGAYFDVFSLNGYSFPNPPETQRILDELNKPVIIGEFHFGSTDRGLPATGIKGVKSQWDRGVAYRHYVESGFARPEIIGIHYFQWHDQPVTGRFDGENYNIGIVDVTYRPYPRLAKAIQKTNSRLFEVATGSKRPFWIKARTMPSIYY